MTVVLLAAGRSSRTSVMKQLYPIKGEYLINRQIRKLRGYGFDVAVVLGHAYEKIRSVLDQDVTIVHNEHYEEGMFSSVKSAFKAVDDEELIFCHIDRPVPDRAVFEALMKSKKPVAVAFYDGEKAPPIRICSSMKELLLASGLERLDRWIKAVEDVDYVKVNDPKVHYNANTDETLKQYFDVVRKR